jgi:hypothetical protein
LKKTLLILLALSVITFACAEAVDRIASRSALSKSGPTRTEVIAYQETFETGATGWTFNPTSGTNQLWHVETVADAPSQTQAMVNQNASNTYNPGMMNYLISPSITLPLSGTIKADFMMTGDFDDPNNPPTSASVTDYWFWDISPNNGTTWYRMSNPYNSPTGTNYVYIDAPTEWSYVTESYTGLDGMISDYAGQTVKFRICFKSDSDGPIGTGIMIDDFTIFNDIFLPAPTNLAAQISGQDVNLAWTAPPSGFSTATITSTNSEWTSYVSDAEGYAMKIVNPFPAPLQLHGVRFMLYRANSAPIVGTPTIHVYTENAGLPDMEIVNLPNVTNIPNYEWKEVDITSFNVMIPASGAVFVGISDFGTLDDQGLLCDSTSTTPNSFALMQGTWDTLANNYTGLSNCGLAGTYWVDDPFAPILSGFKVYHALSPSATYDLIGTLTSPTQVTFTDSAPVAGQINYYKVTGIFDGYESEASNVASIDLIGLLYTEVLNDDGTSNQNFNLGASASEAMKFVTDPDAEIHYAKVYLNGVGNSALITRIYDASVTDGLPSTMLLQFTTAVTNLSVGWNTLPLPDANIITDPDGVFYIAVVEYASAPTFALDTDSNGDSWKKLTSSSSWIPITEGNVMIRALVSWPNANEDMTEVPPVSNLTSYPNPFSQTTIVSFELSKTASATISVYNLKGQLVRTLEQGNLAKGTHAATWDGKDNNGSQVSPGMYFARLESGSATLTQKIVRIK